MDSDFDLYRITYNIDDGPVLNEIYVVRSVDSYELEDLFPATEYNIQVATVSGTGDLRAVSQPASLTESTCKYRHKPLFSGGDFTVLSQIPWNLLILYRDGA